jgi:HemY protein
MRGLLWFLLLFVIAVALAIFGHPNAGHVMIIYAPYRMDMSLNTCVIAIIVVFFMLYAITRLIRAIFTMPRRVAALRARARVKKAHDALLEATGNLFAGRFARAEKAARASLADEANRSAAGLIAAQAAHEMREYTRRDSWLAQVDDEPWQEARLMTSARMNASAHDAQGALAMLDEMPPRGVRRIQAQKIALRAHQQLKNWDAVHHLAKALEKREALHPAVAVKLRQLAAENLLRERQHDADALMALWRSFSTVERHTPRLADLAAQLLVKLDCALHARRIVEEALAQNWDARLLHRYPDTAGDDALPLIQKAEAWQREHPDDVDLLFALGLLCEKQQLWGKAQAFLEAALKATDNATLAVRGHRALAQLYEHLGEMQKAAGHYRQSALAIAST